MRFREQVAFPSPRQQKERDSERGEIKRLREKRTNERGTKKKEKDRLGEGKETETERERKSEAG